MNVRVDQVLRVVTPVKATGIAMMMKGVLGKTVNVYKARQLGNYITLCHGSFSQGGFDCHLSLTQKMRDEYELLYMRATLDRLTLDLVSSVLIIIKSPSELEPALSSAIIR